MAVAHLAQSGFLFDERRKFYLNPQDTTELWKDVAPLTRFMSTRRRRATNDPDYKMFEHRSGFLKMEMSVNDATPAAWSPDSAPNATVTVAVDGLVGLDKDGIGDYLVDFQVFIWNSAKTTKKGVAHIMSVSGNDVTLKAVGNPYASNYAMAALADDDVIEIMHPSFGEGATAGKAFADELQVVYNSSEISRLPVEVTGTLFEAALRGYSSELARLRLEKMKQWQVMREKKYIWGVRSGGTGMGGGIDSFSAVQLNANSQKMRKTMGAMSCVEYYGKTVADGASFVNKHTITKASATYDDWVVITEHMFTNIPSDGYKLGFVGAGFLTWLNQASASGGFLKNSGATVQIVSGISRYGFMVRRLETPHGVVDFVWDPLFRGPWNETCLILDPANVELVQYRGDRFDTNIKTDDGYDGYKDEWFCDDGIGMQLIETHHRIQLA